MLFTKEREKAGPSGDVAQAQGMEWGEAAAGLMVFWLLSLWICSSVQTSVVVWLALQVGGLFGSYLWDGE